MQIKPSHLIIVVVGIVAVLMVLFLVISNKKEEGDYQDCMERVYDRYDVTWEEACQDWAIYHQDPSLGHLVQDWDEVAMQGDKLHHPLWVMSLVPATPEMMRLYRH